MQHIPLGGGLPPVTRFPDPAIFKALGVEGITALLRDVYRNIGESEIAHLFPVGEEALMAAADKSALFWVTACGGPPLYEQKYGQPRMRARHMSFRITQVDRRIWLSCWEPVLAESEKNYGFPPEHLGGFRDYLETFSLWMVNS